MGMERPPKPAADSNLVQLGSLESAPPKVFEIDPVCKMKVMPETAAGHYDYKGRTYYFCSPRCVERFRTNPEQFLGPPKSDIRNSKSEISRTYVCPMDPEIRQTGPGSCPKCGMALEPETVVLEEEENPELKDMTWRFWTAAALSLPIVIMGMA